MAKRKNSEHIAQLESRVKANRQLMNERERTRREMARLITRHEKQRQSVERDARKLERNTQTYKDRQANELRTQLANERGGYVQRTEFEAAVKVRDDQRDAAIGSLTSQMEAGFKPLNEFMAQQQGARGQQVQSRTTQSQMYGIIGTIIGSCATVVFIIIETRPH
jgi:chromosome segregation ATPase